MRSRPTAHISLDLGILDDYRFAGSSTGAALREPMTGFVSAPGRRRMSPLITQFTNRWGSQRQAPSYEDALCWHILLGTDPGVRAAVREAQRRLAPFGGFHMTPERWLHVTVMLVGPAAEITPRQRARMLAVASSALAGTPPVTVTLERVHYSPEGIVLGVSPADALAPFLAVARTATLKATGRAGASDTGAGWAPHLTIGYSTGEQPAAPVIAALGTRLPPCEVTVDRLSLVVQNGAEDLWDWHVEGAAKASGALQRIEGSSLRPDGRDPGQLRCCVSFTMRRHRTARRSPIAANPAGKNFIYTKRITLALPALPSVPVNSRPHRGDRVIRGIA